MKAQSMMVAAAVASLLAGAGCATEKAASKAKEGGTVKCAGVNGCKGQGACSAATHDCAGKNECKGQGWVSLAEQECTAKGGTVVAAR
ncbi:MAG: hypothetical protein SFW67_17875 [Myxococcaceae bacterium]|nr:hypothetical protein [Myxococcaceae bacterium]